MIRAHQPGSEPIDIPETIPNPVVVPKPLLRASRPGAAGFFVLSQSRERPERLRECLRFDTMPSSEFSNVVMSRSMNHKGVEFLILARPGRDQWTVVISYPRSTSPTKVPVEGPRDKAIAVARARIDGRLKRAANEMTKVDAS